MEHSAVNMAASLFTDWNVNRVMGKAQERVEVLQVKLCDPTEDDQS